MKRNYEVIATINKEHEALINRAEALKANVWGDYRKDLTSLIERIENLKSDLTWDLHCYLHKDLDEDKLQDCVKRFNEYLEQFVVFNAEFDYIEICIRKIKA